MAEAKHQPETMSRRKIALVIGVGDYKYTKKLKNATNDANAMASVLQSIGFIVIKKINPTHDEMETVLFKFKQSIHEGDMILFYFSGHGVQWEDQNFLIPKENANNDDDASIQQAVFSLNEMIIQMNDNAGISLGKLKRYMIHVQGFLDDFSGRFPFVTICLLDCCRVHFLRNPNLKKMTAKNPVADASKFSDKKAIVNAGLLIGFACEPGAEADDNEEQDNGLFTKHLLKHIVKPNKDILKILNVVTGAVKEESSSRQVPYCTVSLLTEDDICLCEKVSGT
ncbi:unnamed protein product [Rotaria sp. Silwood2]|nr:unnamed protein product [Rotaria sp. Silwood2]